MIKQTEIIRHYPKPKPIIFADLPVGTFFHIPGQNGTLLLKIQNNELQNVVIVDLRGHTMYLNLVTEVVPYSKATFEV